MWKYNNTNDMYSPELYHSADELYHYGVLGMKWRNRKPSDISLKKQKYISLKKDYITSMRPKKEELSKAKQEYKDAKLLKKAKISRNIKRGLAITGLTLAIYGTHKIKKALQSPSAEYTINGKKYYGKDGYNVAKGVVKTIITKNSKYLDPRY